MNPLVTLTTGSMHLRQGTAAQDAQRYWCGLCNSHPIFIGVVADGAGSTSHGGDGAHFVCETLVEVVHQALSTRPDWDSSWLAEQVPTWLSHVCNQLKQIAKNSGIPFSEYASTCLLAITTPLGSTFGQIGDGAMVLVDDDACELVFWPENGEFANETYFITDTGFESQIRVRAFTRPIQRLAMFTDGLHNLFLHHKNRTVNAELLQAIVLHLEQQPIDHQLNQLRTFVESMNHVSDDDKTLLVLLKSCELNAVQLNHLQDSTHEVL